MSLDLNDPEVRATLESVKQSLLDLGEDLGGWELGSVAIHPQAVQLNIRFGKKAVFTDAQFFVDVLMGCPGRLVNAYRLLLGEEQVTE